MTANFNPRFGKCEENIMGMVTVEIDDDLAAQIIEIAAIENKTVEQLVEEWLMLYIKEQEALMTENNLSET
jgi:predicted transcriptional regulator